MDKEQSPDPPEPEAKSSGITGLWAELRRRHVVRVAMVYLVVGWLVIQVANATFADFGIPVWAYRFVVLMVALGFPISVVLAWAFELTPEGIKTTKSARESQGDKSVSKSHLRKRNWMALGFAAAMPTMVFGALALYFYATRTTPSESVEFDKSIAVLPLQNMSPDPENAFFADGVQEDILTNLSKVDELRVIARTSTQQYRNTTKTVEAIGNELSVNYVVEGSVRRAGNRVKVTVQLIDCSTGDHIWADDYDRNLDDIFAIQAEIAKKIAGELHAALNSGEIERIEYRPTANQAAYDAYVRARSIPERTERIKLLKNAVKLDSRFADAWAELASALILHWEFTSGRQDEHLLESAYSALGRAQHYGPDLARVPYAQSYFALHDEGSFERSIEFLRAALKSDSRFQPALRRLGQLYEYVKRSAEAQQYLEAAVRIDPLDHRTNIDLMNSYEGLEMWEKARELIQQNLSRSEDSLIWQREMASLDYIQHGDRQKYLTDIERIVEFEDSEQHELWKALIIRDFKSANKHIDKLDTDILSIGENRFVLHLRSGGMWMRPLELLNALIWFELDQFENQKREAEKAVNYLKDIVEDDPLADPSFWSVLMVGYALKGEPKLAELTRIRAFKQLQDSPEWKFGQFHNHLPYHFTYVAIANLVFGEHDKAIETLEAASEIGGPIFLSRELDLWFIFDRLRGNSRFEALLKG